MKKIIYYVCIGLAVLILIIALISKNIPPNENPANDKIHLFTPTANTFIASPLIIKGEARGNWFFEASFPVFLTDWDGLIIAQGIAQAEGEWMTTEFVPFTATLNFAKPGYGSTGSLILKKDNPSGLPEHDDALEITVRF
ncbi:MAG: Gmad2 immunoglobulin-like domain-containing protein [Candidatus Paceibacterota bacterium]